MQLQMKQVSGLLSALKTPFSVSSSPPESPVEHQVWLDTSAMILYVYINDTNGPVWVEID